MSKKPQQDNQTIHPHADQSPVEPTEESLLGSDSSERQGCTSSDRVGPTVSDAIELQQKDPCTDGNATSPFHGHKELEEELLVGGTLEKNTQPVVDGDNMPLQCAKPLSDSACYQQQGSQQGSLGRGMRKSLSDSKLAIQCSRNDHEKSSTLVCNPVLKGKSIEALCATTNEDENYNHEDQFCTGKEEKEGGEERLKLPCQEECREEWKTTEDDKEDALAKVPNHASEVRDNEYPW